MRNMVFVIASLAAMLALTACNGERYSAAFGPEPTAAPVPTPYVIIVREPAPAPAQAESDRLPLYLIAGGLLAIALGLGALAVAISTRRAPAPERSQLNERPTYIAPPANNTPFLLALDALPREWSGWSFYRKNEYLREMGYGAGDRERLISAADERRALPAPRR